MNSSCRQLLSRFILFGLLSVSLSLNYFLFRHIKKLNSNIANGSFSLSESQKKYPLLSPRIVADYPNDLIINFKPLRKRLRELVSNYDGTFGLYFEYLPTGVSVGINEKEEYTPQSLIKVPIIMAYLRNREKTGLTNEQIITLKKEQLDNRFGNLWKKGEGYQTTMDEMIALALTESDNTAANVIAGNTPIDMLKSIYEGLDIDFPGESPDIKLSAKQYSSILKSLYFASILNKDNSQKILNLLTQTVFTDKLAAGVPKGISVAHKIGSFKNELFQDCGIVYVPKRPYLLCLISKSSEDEARARMKLISEEVYRYLSSDFEN